MLNAKKIEQLYEQLLPINLKESVLREDEPLEGYFYGIVRVHSRTAIHTGLFILYTDESVIFVSIDFKGNPVEVVVSKKVDTLKIEVKKGLIMTTFKFLDPDGEQLMVEANRFVIGFKQQKAFLEKFISRIGQYCQEG